MQQQASTVDDVIFDRIGSAAIVQLNRPKALNSLNLSMVRKINDALDRFSDDPSVSVVVMTGAGERGLCAGGDIRALFEMGKADDPETSRFWREEFPLNYAISHYSKPYVALMDGITMGGGVGISAHGRYRIVTERTRLAMPETGIGYFPDVGTTWLLPKAPGEVGTWIALSGLEIASADAIYAGLADIVVSSGKLSELVDALGKLRPNADDGDVELILSHFAEAAGDSLLQRNRAIIDRCFRFDSVEEILEALAKEQGEFAAKTCNAMLTRSPTSLKLALRILRAGRDSSGLVECLEREFKVGVVILQNKDFYEGVRAALVDKDRNPQWSPRDLADVTDEAIERYFEGEAGQLFPEHRL